MSKGTNKISRAALAVLVIAVLGVGLAGAMVAGVGPMIGEPIGLTFKVFPRPSLAIALGAGYAWWQDSALQLQGDLVFTPST